MEWSLQYEIRIFQHPDAGEFQSLFSWSGRCNHLYYFRFIAYVMGFNPYFHGVVAAIRKKEE